MNINFKYYMCLITNQARIQGRGNRRNIFFFGRRVESLKPSLRSPLIQGEEAGFQTTIIIHCKCEQLFLYFFFIYEWFSTQSVFWNFFWHCLYVTCFRNRTMRTVTNYFIVNLAVADFLVILICLPPTVLWDVTETWFMGNVACKMVLYFQVSVFSYYSRKISIDL